MNLIKCAIKTTISTALFFHCTVISQKRERKKFKLIIHAIIIHYKTDVAKNSWI